MLLPGLSRCPPPLLHLCLSCLQVVEHGLFVKHCKVEVYLLELKLCENSDPTNVLSCHFSKADTIGNQLAGFCMSGESIHGIVVDEREPVLFSFTIVTHLWSSVLTWKSS